MVSKAAQRYANALYQVAAENGTLTGVHEQITDIHQTIRDSRELSLFLKSPIIKVDDKKEVLMTLFESSVDPLVKGFLELIVSKGRESLLEQITEGFIRLYKKQEGIVDVQVFSAAAVPEDLDRKLRDTLERITGSRVDLFYETRPELLGGMAIQIGDTVIDGTVKHRIDQLKSLFTDAAIGLN